MKRGLLALVTVSLAIPALLACGGVWDQAFNDAVKQEFDKMDGALYGVADSPEKAQVEAMLEQGRRDALSGKIGIMEVAMFEAEFDQLRTDGAFDATEAAHLQKLYDDMVK